MRVFAGTSKLEELVMSRSVIRCLQSRGLKIARYHCGHFMSALDMAGLSVTIMR